MYHFWSIKPLPLSHETRTIFGYTVFSVPIVPKTAGGSAARRHHLCPDGNETPSRPERSSKRTCVGLGWRPYPGHWWPHHGFCAYFHGGILRGWAVAFHSYLISARHTLRPCVEKRRRFGGRRLREQFRSGANLGCGLLSSSLT